MHICEEVQSHALHAKSNIFHISKHQNNMGTVLIVLNRAIINSQDIIIMHVTHRILLLRTSRSYARHMS